MTNPHMIVIALGGNAISRKGEEGSLKQQYLRTSESAELLTQLILEGHELLITHGNGPQVGDSLRRVELAANEVYPVPLHVCVAETQATMGFMITECMNNALRKVGKEVIATTIVTMVEVDPNDPAFGKPTKPIGKYLSRAEADDLVRRHGWRMQEYDKEEFRRVVPSPVPRHILQSDLIRRLADESELLVACGGGGIPVMRNGDGRINGVDCVIDKDRTSALLAAQLGVSRFIIATAVEKVMLDYRTPNARAIGRLTVSEARAHLASGQFPAGTMGPKIEAACDFLENTPHPEPRAFITDLEHVRDALEGRTGTLLMRG